MRQLCILVLTGLLSLTACAAPPPGKVPAEVLKWIDQLGDDEADTRKAAEKNLLALGEGILPALRRAMKTHTDIDARLRAAVIASTIEKTLEGEQRRYEGSTDGVIAFAISPDGKKIASGAWHQSQDRFVRVWEVATGKELMKLDGHQATVGAVAWTKDSKKILSGGHDQNLRLWDAATGKLLKTIPGHAAAIQGVSITPDGKTAVSCGAETTVYIWDLEKGQKIATNAGNGYANRSVAVLPDGKHFVATAFDGSVRIIDLSGKLVRTMTGKHLPGGAWFIGVSPDGKRIATSGGDKMLRLHEVATGKELKTFSGHTDGIHAIAYSPDGKRLVSGGYDKSVRVWDIESGKQVARFDDHTEIVTCAAFLDDRHFITSSYDKTLRLWKIRK